LTRIHALGVLHGDVRKENILLDVKDSEDAEKHCQVRAYGIVHVCLAGAVVTWCQ
jgi:hypothetical protein